MKMITKLTAALLIFGSTASAVELGEVATAWSLFEDHKVKVERFDDPKVENASCYVSYAKTGGLLSAYAEDPSKFSIACRATGPIVLHSNIGSEFEDVYERDASFWFKSMKVARMLDKEKNVLIYLVYSTKLIDGSPFNSISAIPIQ